MFTFLKGIVVSLALAGCVTSQSIGTYDRLSLASLSHLIQLVGDVEPYSCWCRSPQDNTTLCPIVIPNLPVRQDLDISCGSKGTHCCLRRVTDVEEVISALKMVNNITSKKELSLMLNSILKFLVPLSIQTSQNSSNLNENSIPITPQNYSYLNSVKDSVDSVIVQEPAREDPSIADSDGSKIKHQVFDYDNDNPHYFKENPYIRSEVNNLQEFNMFPLSNIQIPGTRKGSKNNVYDDLITALKNVASFLLTPTNHGSKRSTTSLSLGREVFESLYKMLSFLTSENASPRALETNISGSELEKNDINDPYSKLGWFSTSVEAAIDASVYIGLSVVFMFIVATLLNGLISTIGSTCFICFLADNFDLVPVTT